MHVQFNNALNTWTAVDDSGVVLATFDPNRWASLGEFCRYAHSLVEGC